MKFITSFILVLLLIASGDIFAQVAVNIDNSLPDSSAMLDIKSSNRGLLFPRMTTIDIAEISNPANGLMVYNTDSSDFYGFNGNKWIGIWNDGDTLADWYCGNSISYGGQTYGTVLIGSQCWMSENLNVGVRIDIKLNQTNNQTIEKYCYNDTEANCDIYGGLYQWDEMMNYAVLNNQGICPPGWHIPNNTEWNTLKTTAGQLGQQGAEGATLKETGYAHWNSPNTSATNSSGFTGLGGGYGNPDNAEFYEIKAHGYWWSKTALQQGSAYLWKLSYDNAQFSDSNEDNTIGSSVRCLKN